MRSSKKNGKIINEKIQKDLELRNAIRNNQTDRIISMFISGNVDIHSETLGIPLLVLAAFYRNTDCCKLLLEHGVNRNSRDWSTGFSAFDIAKARGYQDIIDRKSVV